MPSEAVVLPGPRADDRRVEGLEDSATRGVRVGADRVQLPLVVGKPPVQQISSLLLLAARSEAHVTSTLL
jgi:hypothetical protein